MTMTISTIDTAMQAHLDWIQKFNAALDGTGTRTLDLTKARDDSACSLGCWLADKGSHETLGDEYHARTKAIHSAFHEIAGEVVTSLDDGDPIDVTLALIAALKDLSKGLIEFLEFAKRRLECAPRKWQF